MHNKSSKIGTESQKSQAAVDWNLQEVLDRIEGDQEFLRELLAIFKEDCRTCLDRARTALAKEDLTELSRAAHTIKGMMKNLAMNSGSELAATLEIEAQQGHKELSIELLAKLETAVASILREVEVHMTEVKV